MTHFAVLKDKNLKPENIKKGVKIFKVTGTFEGGGDWLADALAENITDLSGYELPGLKGEGRYSYLFRNTPIVKTPNINGALDGLNVAYHMFADCSALTEADLSNLTSLKGYNLSAGESMFANCTNLVSVDLSGLVEVKGQDACYSMFANCTSLKSVNLGSLSVIGSYSADGPFRYMFNICTNLTDITIHPNAIGRNTLSWNLLTSAIYIENLYLTDNATDIVWLTWQPNLTAASVLNVLTHLDLSVAGKHVNFYSGGLAVDDDANGSIQTAYDAAVAAGWAINNPRITPYS